MRTGKALHITLVVMIALFLIGHFLLNNKKIQQDAALHVVRIAQSALKTDVSAGRVQLTYPFGMSIEDLTVYDLRHDTLAHAASVSLRLKPFQLLRRKVSITSVRVNTPSIRLYTDSLGAEPNYAFLTALMGGGDKPMTLRANSVLVRNGSLRYDLRSAAQTDSLFNPDHIGISGFTANISLKALSKDSVNLIVRKLVLTEQSGFRLTKTRGTVTIGREFTQLSGLMIATPGSQFTANRLTAQVGMASGIHRLPAVNMDVKATVTGSDFKALVPRTAYMTDPIDIAVKGLTEGNKITLNALYINAPRNLLDMGMSGTVLVDTAINVTGCRFAEVHGSFSDELPQWIEQQFAGFPVTVPAQCMSLGMGTFKGSLDSHDGILESSAEIKSRIGTLLAVLNGQDNMYDASLEAIGVDLGTVTGNRSLGKCSLTAEAQIRKDGRSYSGDFNSLISSLTYNKYNYRDIAASGRFDPKLILTDLRFADKNGALALNAGVGLGDSPSYKLNLKADSLDLAAYNLVGKESMSLSAQVTADLTGRYTDDMTGRISVDSLRYADSQGDWTMENLTVVIGEFSDFVKIITVTSDFMNMSVAGNYRISGLPGSLAKACGDVLPTIGIMVGDKLGARNYSRSSNSLAIEANVNNIDFMQKVFHSPVAITKPAEMRLSLIDADSTCTGYISVPQLMVQDQLLTDGLITINSDKGTCRTGITGLYGDLADDPTSFNISLLAFMDIVRSDCAWHNRSGQMQGKLHCISQFFKYDRRNGLKSLTFLDSTDITLNGIPWHLSISRISTDMRKLEITDFTASNRNQSLHADGVISSDSTDIFRISMTNIDLGNTLTAFHVNDYANLKGIATGYMTIAGLLDRPAFYGSLQVNYFEFMKSYHGTLTADCRWNQELRQVELTGTMVNGDLEHTGLSGIYIPREKWLDATIEAGQTDLYFLNKWTSSAFKEISGRAAEGNLRIFGTLPHLDMEGQAIIEDAYFDQAAVNTTFIVRRDTLWFEPGKMIFKDVEFYDKHGHDGLLTCILGHDKFSHWTVDMSADVADMLVYYQPVTERSPIYASVYAEGSMTLKLGHDKKGLAVTVDARTAPGTRIGYKPTSGTVADYNFLTIVDRNTIKLDEEAVKTIIPAKTKSGNYSLDFDIECSEDALIEMNMESLNGFFRGNGNISLKYEPKDGPILNGIYNLSYGQCALSIEDLIRKNFTLMEGSYVRFNGAPMDTELSLHTYHNVNSASIYDLDPSASSNNKVHVRCLMDITGNVTDPRISVDIDMPNGTPEEKAVLATATATEEQRNNQFMYLLAIGRFYTYDVAAMNDGMTPSAMESIVNSTVSGQINNVLSQVLDNEKVSISSNVSASSYLSNDATNLNNKELEGILEAHLLNNRLLLNGNFGYRENTLNNTSNFIGDFEFKYLLIPDKQGKGISIKGYNKANDKYFSKTTLTTQGVGLVFEKDF